MDLSEKDKLGLEQRSGDHLGYHSSGITADWQFGSHSADPSIQMNSSPCPSVSMVDSFCPGLWNHPSNPQSLGFSENNATATATTSSSIPVGKPVAMCWSPGILPPSLSHFPADSGFIERAARFSCFNGSSFSGLVNPFGVSEPVSPYSGTSKGLSGAELQKNETRILKEVSMPTNHSSTTGSPINDQRDKGDNEMGDPEFSGDGQEETTNSSKGLGAKKRKRTNQDMELEQAQVGPQLSVEITKENVIDAKLKGEQNSSTMATVKPSGKNAKDSSDAPKEDYIHVRARRGQATNSHSLAERVRREKISERMRFLQDLVPGCSKVTGKAVMLDEIINYVQSLQRQVEFLSMKLAAVNPRLDLNIEGLLSKDLLPPRIGSSSAIGFSPDMIQPQLQPSQQGLVQAGMPGIVNPSEALRRAINVQMTAMSGYKEPPHQMRNSWEEELHNIVQMTYGGNLPFNPQELNGKPRDGFPL